METNINSMRYKKKMFICQKCNRLEYNVEYKVKKKILCKLCLEKSFSEEIENEIKENLGAIPTQTMLTKKWSEYRNQYRSR